MPIPELLRPPIVGALGTLLVLVGGSLAPPAWLHADDPAPAAAAAAADDAASPEKPAETAADPADLLRQARERLGRYSTIETDIVQTTYFDQQRFEATGHYLQGRDLKLRLDYEVQVGATTGRLLQVSDGSELYTEYRIGPEVRVSLRNIRRILEAARRHGASGERLMVAELGLGGLPAMIAALELAYTFDEVDTEMVGDAKLHVVKGSFNEAFRQQIEAAGGTSPLLAPYIGDRVHVYLDEQLVPRLIKYMRSGGGNVNQRVVTLEFRNTRLNGEIDDSRFEYRAPKGAYLNDVTNDYLQKLQAAPNAPATP